MNARIAASTIVVICGQASIGCGGSNAPYNPVSPSPPPPIAAPTPPPPSLARDLTGDYALRFEVGNGCGQVPKELRTRTYEARIRYVKSFGTSDLFFAELSGSRFHRYQAVSIEATGNVVYVDLSDNIILEEPSRDSFLATAGYGAASVQPTQLSTISGLFRGYFNYCAPASEDSVQNGCSLDVVVHNLCLSENSRWSLTRR